MCERWKEGISVEEGRREREGGYEGGWNRERDGEIRKKG